MKLNFSENILLDVDDGVVYDFTLTYNDTVKADSPITDISLGDEGLFTVGKGDGDNEPVDGLDSNLRFIPKDDVDSDEPTEEDVIKAAESTGIPGTYYYNGTNEPDDKPIYVVNTTLLEGSSSQVIYRGTNITVINISEL
jgi:hypothetical protein